LAGGRRVALKKHEEDVKRWVQEGRSDGWIANALGTSPSSIQSFRSRRGIRRGPDGRGPRAPRGPAAYEGVLERDPRSRRIGAWFDPAVQDDPFYERRWKKTRRVGVRLTRERIVLTDADR